MRQSAWVRVVVAAGLLVVAAIWPLLEWEAFPHGPVLYTEAPAEGIVASDLLALIPLSLDGFLFSDAYQSGKKAEIKSRLAANFVGWDKDHALFDRKLEKVVRALRTNESGREKPPASKL